MPILHKSKNFQVEPFADSTGVYFLILRKSNRKVIAKIPVENKARAVGLVKSRLKELEEANRITTERIKKVQKTSKDIFSFLKKSGKAINKELNKKSKKKRR